MSDHRDIIKTDACTLVRRLRRGDVTPHDLLDALQHQIAEVDPKVNALPTLAWDRARSHADRLMQRKPAERGVLAGLPVPIKDTVDVAGVRTTHGSPIYADHVPSRSDIVAERLEANGAIVYAKSNTPEFAAGGNTFNEVFGATLNPWDLSRSAAGSSGGAAVALATGMAWLAHGTDMGGSLRNPASFCGVVGLRPSIGRVAHSPVGKIDRTLSVHGPMARNVADLALMLDAMVGEHPVDPLALPAPSQSFGEAVRGGFRPRRVAYSATLGITPVDPEIAAITRGAAERLSREGIVVEEAHPDLAEAHQCFQVLRALDYAVGKSALLGRARDRIKPEVIWNIEKGLALSVGEIGRAEADRVAMSARMLAFLDTYDLLLTPATIVPPFPVGQRHVTECAGVKFANYVEWLAIAYAITLVCCPALSLPCGFTASHLPVGLQIIAPPRGEARLLAAASTIEQILDLGALTPIAPRPSGDENRPR